MWLFLLQGDLDPLASLKSLTYLRYGNDLVVTVKSFILNITGLDLKAVSKKDLLKTRSEAVWVAQRVKPLSPAKVVISGFWD